MTKLRKILFSGSFLLVLCLPSCTQPPAQTLITDIGGKPTVVWDRDQDGVPDVNEEGQVDVLGDYGLADTADSILPTVLQGIAGILGIPILLGIGAAWRKHKFARIITNTVMSVQAARQRLKDKNLDTALDIVDETLGSSQTRETTAIIRDVKKTVGAPSVS